MKKGLFIGFIVFLALCRASFAHAEIKIETPKTETSVTIEKNDQKSLLSTIEKLTDLVDRTQATLNRFATKGFDTEESNKLLQNAANTLIIAHDGLVAKDAKNQITFKKVQELVKSAKQSLIDSLTTLKTSTDTKTN